MSLPNPVKKGYALRLARPLPRYLKDEEVLRLFQALTGLRDHAIFMLMLRCGLRVEEVAHLDKTDFVTYSLPLSSHSNRFRFERHIKT